VLNSSEAETVVIEFAGQGKTPTALSNR
jgi:hypothetical protein